MSTSASTPDAQSAHAADAHKIQQPGASPRPSRLLPAVALTAVVAGAAGWLAAGNLETPEERAAARAPVYAAVTAPVEERPLDARLVLRADVQHEDAFDLTAPESLFGSVVTEVVAAPGRLLQSGDVIVEIQGRPLLVLEGDLPAWRDMAPGAEGPDVMQLQQALADLGHYQARLDGKFGPQTIEAVKALYLEAGYAPTAAAKDSFIGKSQDAQAPASEVLFVPGLPQRVHALHVQRGDRIDGALAIMSGSGVIAVAELPTGRADRPQTGESVELVTADGATLNGRVLEPVDVDLDQGRFRVSVERADDYVGANVRVEVVTARTAGPVLVAPLAAVHTAADGSTSVRVERAGMEDRVEVELGLRDDGYVQVTPLRSGELHVGDRVVVDDQTADGAAP